MLLGIAAVVGAQCGLCGGFTGLLAPGQPQSKKEYYPFPHHIPRSPGNVTLRFAMVHDVLHERFPRHGPAYYAERNRRIRQELDELQPELPLGEKPPEKYWALLDDLGVGLEFVGEHDEAVRVLRDKLRQQQALGLTGRELYSTYANLGTFLILGPFVQVRPGNEDDKRVLREGLDLMHKSIEVNPDAHFGREIWQAVIIEYMLAAYDDPQVLLKYDMIGNRLDKPI